MGQPTHVDISVPQNKCTALKRTALKNTNGSIQFGAELDTGYFLPCQEVCMMSPSNANLA